MCSDDISEMRNITAWRHPRRELFARASQQCIAARSGDRQNDLEATQDSRVDKIFQVGRAYEDTTGRQAIHEDLQLVCDALYLTQIASRTVSRDRVELVKEEDGAASA